jgi:hypothetical protein
MVPSSVLAVAVDGERLLCSGFSHSKTNCFGSLEFVADCFSRLNLSPMGDCSDTDVTGSARSGP